MQQVWVIIAVIVIVRCLIGTAKHESWILMVRTMAVKHVRFEVILNAIRKHSAREQQGWQDDTTINGRLDAIGVNFIMEEVK